MKSLVIIFIVCGLPLLCSCGQKETDPAPQVGSKTYSLTITVSGEGTVAEKLADYSSGSIVELTANPSAGWRFSRWEGDLQGEANPAEIEVTSPKTVSALFEKENYSFNVRIVGPGVVDEFLSEDTKATLGYGTRVRLAAFPSEGAVFKGWSGGIESNQPEIEYSVSTSDEIIATYDLDEVNDCKFEGLINGPRKMFYGDFNGDGNVDVAIVGHGYDGAPWPGESPIILFGSSSGEYSMQYLTEAHGYYHGSCAGDFDNDGDLDIFLLDHGIFGLDNTPQQWYGDIHDAV